MWTIDLSFVRTLVIFGTSFTRRRTFCASCAGRVCRLARAVSLRRAPDALAHAEDLSGRERLDVPAIA